MRIRELYLKNFGKFSDTQFYLSDKIHVFYGENEYGKSTIYAFIKAMLFGMERGRGRAAGKDDFSRYEPWENPNYYAGVMRFTCGGRNFRLERQFDRYAKQALLICEDDGEELSVEDGDLTMLLGGMTLPSFENTAAVGRLTAEPGKELAAELKNYAANYCETGGGGINLQGALESLRAKKKTVEQQLRERQENVEKEAEKIRIQSRYVEQEEEKLKTEYQEKQEKLKECLKKQKSVERKIKELEQEESINRGNGSKEKERPKEDRGFGDTGKKGPKEDGGFGDTGKKRTGNIGWRMLLAGLAAAVLGIFAGSFAETPRIRELMFGITGIGILFLFIGGIWTGMEWYQRKKRRRSSLGEGGEEETPSMREIQSERENWNALEDSVRQLRWECRRIQEERKEKMIQQNNLQEQIEEVMQKDDAFQQMESRKQALELAAERLKNTAEAMTKNFGVRLNQEASDILAKITDGKYTRLLIDDRLGMTVYHDGRRIPAERLSRGTLEQIYFSLRMAALDILYEEEIPVILDDAFVFYDEKRLKSVLKWLSEQSRQVIIFSCQRRELELLEG